MLRVLLRLIKRWITNLDNNIGAEAVLMDLSKVFDCISHDLLIVKLDAYGLEKTFKKRKNMSFCFNCSFDSAFLQIPSPASTDSLIR